MTLNLDKIKTSIKRIFSNPNTITFILVLVLIVIVYFVYIYMVNRAISPVKVPYCISSVKSLNEITDEHVGTIEISGNFATANGSSLIQSARNVKGKFVAPGYTIPEHSFFYQDAIAESSIQEETAFTNLPDNYTIFKLKVDFHSTYGCSIMSGNYIDLYFKAKDVDNDGKLMYALFIKSIQVMKVVDKDGKDVFTESDKDDMKPAQLWFAVPEQYFELLKYATEDKKYGIELIPVPRNAGYTENPEDTTIANDAIESLILSNASTKK